MSSPAWCLAQPRAMSTARLDAFAREQIFGLRQAGKKAREIQKLEKKTGGKRAARRSIERTLAKQVRRSQAWRRVEYECF